MPASGSARLDAACGAGAAASFPLVAYLMRRLGSRRLALLSALVLAAVLILLSVAPNYPVALLILEGDPAEISEFKSPQAVLGALVAIEIDERVPVLNTADRDQTAALLAVIWKRQDRVRAAYGLRHKPKTLDLEERQRFLVEGLPNVGDTLARNLLEHFGSVRAVFTADAEELRQVPKIGEGKAAEIARVLGTRYEGRQRRLDDEDPDA